LHVAVCHMFRNRILKEGETRQYGDQTGLFGGRF